MQLIPGIFLVCRAPAVVTDRRLVASIAHIVQRPGPSPAPDVGARFGDLFATIGYCTCGVSQSVTTGAARSGPLRRVWPCSARCRLRRLQTCREVSASVLGSAVLDGVLCVEGLFEEQDGQLVAEVSLERSGEQE